MAQDLVVGLDSSTQSSRAIAWTREGEPVGEGRADIALSTPRAGWVEQEPEDWRRAAREALTALTREIDPSRIAGLAISNQRETVAFLGGDQRTLRPAMVWLDERGGEMLKPVTDALGLEFLHRTTGKHPDLTPVIYRLAWMRRHEPETLDAARVLDVHGALTWMLTGSPAASWTSADPTGVLDIARKEWSPPILAHLGLRADQFAPLHRPGAQVGAVTSQAAAETGLAEGTPVYAGGGDGQCAGLGVDAARRGRLFLNLGTAVITGAWSPTAEVSRFWRTMTAPDGEGYFLEGCQRAGAYLVNWFMDAFAGGRDADTFARLEKAAAQIPIGCGGLAMCPHLTGCMDPHWDHAARGSFVGLNPSHGQAHLYRALLEAITLESARAIVAMRGQGVAAERILAVGGGAQSALWMRMIADAAQLPVTRSASIEASSLGAAMSAAVGAGWHGSFAAASQAMSAEGETVEPDPSTADAWAVASARQAAAYRPGG